MVVVTAVMVQPIAYSGCTIAFAMSVVWTLSVYCVRVMDGVALADTGAVEVGKRGGSLGVNGCDDVWCERVGVRGGQLLGVVEVAAGSWLQRWSPSVANVKRQAASGSRASRNAQGYWTWVSSSHIHFNWSGVTLTQVWVSRQHRAGMPSIGASGRH